MNILAENYVTCTDGANKFYLPRIIEDGGEYQVVCAYGPIGAQKPQSTVKYSGPDLASAEKAFAKALNEKLNHGYLVAPMPAALGGSGATATKPAATLAGAAGSVTTKLAPVVTASGKAAASAASPGERGAELLAAETPAGNVPVFAAQLAADIGQKAIDLALANPARYQVEEKFDGFRALVVFDGEKLEIRNRYGQNKGRLANAPRLEGALRALGDEVGSLWRGSILDGELVGASWSQTAHLLSGLGREEAGLRFVVFDLPVFAGEDIRRKPLRQRRQLLETVLDAIEPGEIEISVAMTARPGLAEEIWQRGGEGLLIKDLEGPYVPGNRTYWYKVKQEQTAEAVITGFDPGKGKYDGMVGAVVVGQYRNGTLVEVTRVSGMTDAERGALTPDDIGRVIEFEFQDRTESSYRHPRWIRLRDDKDPEDCTW